MVIQPCKNCLQIEKRAELEAEAYKKLFEEVLELENSLLTESVDYNKKCLTKLKLIEADVKERLHNFTFAIKEFLESSTVELFNSVENHRERLKMSLDVFHREAQSTLDILNQQMHIAAEQSQRLAKMFEELAIECDSAEFKNFQAASGLLEEFKILKRDNRRCLELLREKIVARVKRAKKDEARCYAEDQRAQLDRSEQTVALLKAYQNEIRDKITVLKSTHEGKDLCSDLETVVAKCKANEAKLKKRLRFDLEGFQTDLKFILKDTDFFEKSLAVNKTT